MHPRNSQRKVTTSVFLYLNNTGVAMKLMWFVWIFIIEKIVTMEPFEAICDLLTQDCCAVFTLINTYIISETVLKDFFPSGFTDENSKWLKPAKRKRKLEEPPSEDDSDEHWEEEEDEEEEEKQPLSQKKGGKEKTQKNAKTAMKEEDDDEDDDDEGNDDDEEEEDDDEDEAMIDDYGTLDEEAAAEEESDGEEVSTAVLDSHCFC